MDRKQAFSLWYVVLAMVLLMVGLSIVVGVTYLTQPGARTDILSVDPLLLLLVCPIWLRFMMKTMPTEATKMGKPSQRTHRRGAGADLDEA